MKVGLTILFIGFAMLVCALIAGVVREIVDRYKPVQPPRISSTIEFGNPNSTLTYEHPGDNKLKDIIK